MKIILGQDPKNIFGMFGYSRGNIQRKPGIEAEHGSFLFGGRRYLIELVRTVSEERVSSWVVSKVSLLSDATSAAEMIYHFKEEAMADPSSSRKTYPIVVRDFPILAVCDATHLVKVYEFEDLASGIGLKFGKEFLRFRPKPYADMLRLKVFVAEALHKKCLLLPHEESKDKYDFLVNFFQENELAQHLG